MSKLNKYQILFLKWRKRQQNNRMLPFLLSIVTGLVVGLSAILIKTIISYVEIYAVYFSPKVLFFFFPLIGFLLVTLLNKTIFKNIAYFQGARNAIEAIEQKSSIINFRLIYSKFLTTGLTIGFGGSSGVEAAIITTGSAIGSNIGQFLGLGYRLRTLLIGCGIAAGISAVYNAPTGGFIFALETVLPAFTPTLLIPLLISAATGKILFEFIMGEHLRFESRLTPFPYDQIPLIIILGVLAMLTASYLSSTYRTCARYFTKIKNDYLRALTGGLALGTLIFFIPPMYGEGYISINALLKEEEQSLFLNSPLAQLSDFTPFRLVFFLFLTLLKPVSTGICVNSGGEGGYFAPSLITGGFLGYTFYKLVLFLFPGLNINADTYIFLGMAGTFACVMNAPVTAIFLIAEITQSYQLFVPLMLICAVSYFLKYYKENLRPKGDPISEKQKSSRLDRIILNELDLETLIDKNYIEVKPTDSLRTIVEKFTNAQRNILLVLNQSKHLEGIITLNEIRKQLQNTSSYDSILAKDIMQPPTLLIEADESIASIMAKFDKSNIFYLPVVKKGVFKGFISKSQLLAQYRDELMR
ncbi:MAG: chloride channel protein, partial [Bacteroidota bacterium]|nr:chloride channel protein [Bacteroidota bacterium]